MNIIKCDKCGKRRVSKELFKWTNVAISGPNGYRGFDFCNKCGDKIISKLKNNLKLNADEKTDQKMA